MLRLNLIPEASNFTNQDGAEVVATQLEGGLARYRRDIFGAAHRVEVAWTLNPEQYDQFRLFWHAIRNGSHRFELTLPIDGTNHVICTCAFVPDTMKTSKIEGLAYTVVAQLEVIAPFVDEDTAESLWVAAHGGTP